MTIRLILESAPNPQAESERHFHGGTLVIGRGDEADWQFNDPDMYVSRRHCILSDESGAPMVTDASSGGLFIDNSANPVGAGNAVPIEDGMRLRIGDFVVKVELNAEVSDTPPAPDPGPQPGAFSFDFGPAPVQAEKPERPDSLPDPFDPRSGSRGKDPFGLADEPEEPVLKPADWENPMGLDLRSGGPVTEPGRALGGDPFSAETETQPELSGPGKYFGGGADAPLSEPSRAPEPPHTDPAPFAPDDMPVVAEAHVATGSESAPDSAPAATTAPAASVAPVAPPGSAAAVSDNALRAALLRGMGLDAASIPASADPEAEMEALGARFRELVDGLMMLLRSRAQEKSRARVAQTIIANEDVNPLKFLATAEDALSALIQPRGKGYLPPDQAVTWAFRDLADHQLRTWTALQAALRRMIDRFDPEQIEKEAEDLGLLEKLIAGGKSAKMWDMYEEHYRDLAQSAEEQFLGEVGADFREAYETKRSK